MGTQKKDLITLAEQLVQRAFDGLEKKLMKMGKKSNKQRKKQRLKNVVSMAHGDLSEKEQKSIVSHYNKKDMLPPTSAFKKRELVSSLEYENRRKELQLIRMGKEKGLER